MRARGPSVWTGCRTNRRTMPVRGFSMRGQRHGIAERLRAVIAARPVQPSEVMRLVALEAEASGWEKRRYLAGWFTDTAHRKTFVVAQGGQITGFATVRACREGAKIGPLWAQDKPTAVSLLDTCAGVFTGPISVDVPSSSDLLDDVCTELGLVPGFQTARMYRGPSQPGASRLFAVTSLELG